MVSNLWNSAQTTEIWSLCAITHGETIIKRQQRSRAAPRPPVPRNRTGNNSISYLTSGNLGLMPSHLYKLYYLLRSAEGILMNKMRAPYDYSLALFLFMVSFSFVYSVLQTRLNASLINLCLPKQWAKMIILTGFLINYVSNGSLICQLNFGLISIQNVLQLLCSKR